MKTLIIIDNRVWGKVKNYATVEEISLSSAVEVLLKKALNESRDEVKVEGRAGLLWQYMNYIYNAFRVVKETIILVLVVSEDT